MRSTQLLLGLVTASALAYAGCSSNGTESVGEDTGTPADSSLDTKPQDSTTDTKVGDADAGETDATTGDAGGGDAQPGEAGTDDAALDSAAGDGSTSDTTSDTTAADTAVGDTALTDTGADAVADTGADAVADTSPADTGADVAVDTGPDAAAGKEAVASALATALCSRQKACGEFGFGARWSNEATCVARHTLELLDRLTATGTGDTLATYAACTSGIATLACDKVANYDLPAACKPVGTIATTAACAWHSQCASGYCAREPDEHCGKCAAPPVPGASCALVHDCGYGLVCLLDTCRTYGKTGDACDVDTGTGAAKPCLPGLGCVLAGTTTTGTCGAAIALGAACDYDQECDAQSGQYCQAGLVTTDPWLCAKTPVRAVGALCSDGTEVCVGGSACYVTGTTSTCVADAIERATCNLTTTSSGPGCTWPAVCDFDSKTCLLPTAATCL